jgi:hypothetical protein
MILERTVGTMGRLYKPYFLGAILVEIRIFYGIRPLAVTARSLHFGIGRNAKKNAL